MSEYDKQKNELNSNEDIPCVLNKNDSLIQKNEGLKLSRQESDGILISKRKEYSFDINNKSTCTFNNPQNVSSTNTKSSLQTNIQYINSNKKCFEELSSYINNIISDDSLPKIPSSSIFKNINDERENFNSSKDSEQFTPTFPHLENNKSIQKTQKKEEAVEISNQEPLSVQKKQGFKLGSNRQENTLENPLQKNNLYENLKKRDLSDQQFDILDYKNNSLNNPKLSPEKIYQQTKKIENTDQGKKSSAKSKKKSCANNNIVTRKENGGLQGLMLMMFEGTNIIIQDIYQLNEGEKIILASLLKRKFSIEIDLKTSNNEIATIINYEKNNAKPKRLEENYKLVFKRALKFLLTKLYILITHTSKFIEIKLRIKKRKRNKSCFFLNAIIAKLLKKVTEIFFGCFF